MIYTELTKKAISIAYNAHHGQVDKAGVPYVCHPLHLAESMEDEISCCAALLSTALMVLLLCARSHVKARNATV